MDESAVDICAICLSPIGEDSEQSAEEAFLDNCYHRYHQQCIMSWTTAQKAHPSLGPVYSCPLCKAPYTSVLHTFQDNTFRQEWVMPGPYPPSLILTPQQRRRRSVYFNAASPALAGHLRNSTTLVTANEIESWVTRELQAVTLEEDVKLICQVALATINTSGAALCDTGTRRTAGNAAMKVRYSNMSGLQMQHWEDNMAAAVSPFTTDHAVRFAQELLGFLSSNLSITGHDLSVFGEDVQPSQGQELATTLEQDSSSTSGQSSQGGISDNDSEAYVSLVHYQPTLQSAESSGACGSEADLAEDTVCPANVNRSDPGAVALHETGQS
ncbi:hypothetical protein WJX77_010193 [Trebouxia sp. C0004]